MLLRRLLKIIKLNHLHEIFKIDKIMSSPTKQILSITDDAAERIKILIAKRDKPTVGIKVGVKQGGCSGLSYTFEYCDQKGEFDETIEDKGVVVIVDPKAVMFIIGTTLDFVDEKVKSGFVFINPNESGRCGCGSSFSVKR
jgi:iron-sulfur cluster assembly protein